MPLLERVELAYRAGSSDKVYVVELHQEIDGCEVRAFSGRRGATLLSQGVKTPGRVNEVAARRVLHSVVEKKRAKGYDYAEGVTAGYVPPANLSVASEPAVQLLDVVEVEEAGSLLDDDRYVLQEKHDGERRVLRRRGAVVSGLNRKGQPTALPADVVGMAHALAATGDFVVDGESVGDQIKVFDLLEADGENWRTRPFLQRHARLVQLAGQFAEDAPIWVSPVIRGAADKRRLFEAVRDGGREGVVFKRGDAPYTSGLAAGLRDQIKCKFVESATVIIGAPHAVKRSVTMLVTDGERLVEVGSVTIPGKQPIPAPGTIAEVRYLYAFPGGSLFQPRYLGPRLDVDADAATTAQLKFKPGVDAPRPAGPGR